MGLKWKDLEYGSKDKNDSILLKLIIDVNKKKVYVIPFSNEHITFVSRLLGVDREEIFKHPEIAKKFVGAYIRIDKNNEIEKVIVGSTTGLTLGAKVKYSPKDIDKAYKILWGFIYKGEIPYKKNFEFKKLVA